MKRFVLGLGNILLADNGVGVHAVRALRQDGGADGARILEIGTAVLDALPAFEDAEKVIVIDAVKAEGRPGSVYRLAYPDIARKPCIASVHGFDLTKALVLAKRNEPPEVVLIGVEPGCIDWSLKLSQEVQDALPVVLSAVHTELVRCPYADMIQRAMRNYVPARNLTNGWRPHSSW